MSNNMNEEIMVTIKSALLKWYYVGGTFFMDGSKEFLLCLTGPVFESINPGGRKRMIFMHDQVEVDPHEYEKSVIKHIQAILQYPLFRIVKNDNGNIVAYTCTRGDDTKYQEWTHIAVDPRPWEKTYSIEVEL